MLLIWENICGEQNLFFFAGVLLQFEQKCLRLVAPSCACSLMGTCGRAGVCRSTSVCDLCVALEDLASVPACSCLIAGE